jgi:cytidylate kinase
MVILLNGAFGVGKTTVACLVANRLSHCARFDPELAGFVLHRASRLAGRPVEDFQDLALWRRLVVLGVHATTKVRRNVIVPMAFSNLSYLEEVRAGIARFESRIEHFCLVAPVEVVHERLRRRGFADDRDRSWQDRRAAECCVAHEDPIFGERISTSGLTAGQVADQLLARIALDTSADR